jgi:protein LTV1
MSRRKTKPWISKDKSVTFDIVYRSNRDLHADEKGASPLVLVPKIAPKNFRQRSSARLTAASSIKIPSFIPPEVLPHEIDDPAIVGQDLNISHPHQLKALDPELLAALQNPDAFEELNDDFIVVANAYEIDAVNDNDGKTVDVGDDDTKHATGKQPSPTPPVSIEPLDDTDCAIEQPASSSPSTPTSSPQHLSFSHLDAAVDKTHISDADTAPQNPRASKVGTPPNRRRNTFIEEKFFATLAKYDQTAELSANSSDEDVGVDNLERFNDVFDEFLASQKRTKYGGPPSGKHQPTRLFKKDITEENNNNNDDANEGDDYDDNSDSCDIDDVDREFEELYLAQEDENVEQYDCESILSTYSNTENHPTLICEEVPKSKIQLNRHGIPKYVVSKLSCTETTATENSGVDRQSATEKKANLGQPRPRHENSKDRRDRKQHLKQERRIKRAQKKSLKMTYKTEETRQKQQRTLGVLHHKTILRY